MIHARFSPKAERDLEEHTGFIAADDPDEAKRVRHLILNTADFLTHILTWGGASERPLRVTPKSAGSLCRSSATTSSSISRLKRR